MAATPADPGHALATAWARLRAVFTLPSSGEPADGRLRARQLQAIVRLTPLAAATNIVNALIIAAVFWGHAPRAFLVGWGLSVAAVMGLALRGWWRGRGRPPRDTASEHALQRTAMHAGLLAMVWSAPPLVLLPAASSPHRLLLATVVTGMICAGGFALATVPRAGTVYVVILGLASAASLVLADFELAIAVGALLVLYCTIVIASVWSTARLFRARLAAESQTERQNEVIGLLLRDFEEHASDLLWEVGPEGRLRHTSARLAEMFGRTTGQLGRQPALVLLRRMAGSDPAGRARLLALQAALQSRQPFRDLPLRTERDGDLRWWSLTAKPLSDAQGQPAGWRGVARDITESRRASEQLSWMAHYDGLTSLANRHRFRAELAQLLEDGAASAPFALLCLDLDRFKAVNDTLGHVAGDGLLQAVAERLRDCTRRSDTVARLGGDEFAVILRQVHTSEEAMQMAERILEGLNEPCEVQGGHVSMRGSVGVALAPRDGADIDTLLSHADMALYAAKAHGRGAARLFQPEFAQSSRRRVVLEQALRDALVRDELSLAFQPQVDFADWRVTGFEALLRWQHPQLGGVAPSEFIPVAEDAGLIQSLGRWVLVEACRQAAHWPTGLTLSVNVSPVQAMSPDLALNVRQALRESGLDPGRLELEITESIFLGDAQQTLRLIDQLHTEGVRVALDDFGTGYSSLAYLRRFPFDTLKIDRSFVQELLTRRDARAVVRLIVSLARTLGMKTVAEGVEEPEQASRLGSFGCQALQGYLVARPMPAAAVADFLAGWPHEPRPTTSPPPTTISGGLADAATPR